MMEECKCDICFWQDGCSMMDLRCEYFEEVDILPKNRDADGNWFESWFEYVTESGDEEGE